MQCKFAICWFYVGEHVNLEVGMVPLNSFYFTNGEGYVPLILHLGSGVTWG